MEISSDICHWILSVPRSSQFSEICSILETGNVREQISEHIFAPNGGYCLYILWSGKVFGVKTICFEFTCLSLFSQVKIQDEGLVCRLYVS